MTLSDRQQAMLAELASGKSYSIRSMVDALKLSRNGQIAENVTFCFARLVDLGLAKVDEARQVNHGKGYLITPAGRKHLRTKPVQQSIAPIKTRISPMLQPMYQPPMQGYVRNAGHGHYPSGGAW